MRKAAAAALDSAPPHFRSIPSVERLLSSDAFGSLVEEFGRERVMYGSDWPVMTRAARYEQWVEALQAVTAALPEASRRKLFSENARTFYRLPATGGNV